MVEGEKLFDISVRWPKWRRCSETSILDIPVDIINNQVVLAQGSSSTPSASGHALPPPAVSGSLADTSNPISSTPQSGWETWSARWGRTPRLTPAVSSIAPGTRPSIASKESA